MLFFDTSAIFAWFSPRDKNHRRAGEYIQLFRSGETGFKRLVVTDAILAEALDLTQIKLGKDEAIRLGNILQQSKVIDILELTGVDRISAMEVMEKYRDQGSNFTDSLSFALMERLGMATAFAFDKHFEIHGFTTVP